MNPWEFDNHLLANAESDEVGVPCISRNLKGLVMICRLVQIDWGYGSILSTLSNKEWIKVVESLYCYLVTKTTSQALFSINRRSWTSHHWIYLYLLGRYFICSAFSSGKCVSRFNVYIQINNSFDWNIALLLGL